MNISRAIAIGLLAFTGNFGPQLLCFEADDTVRFVVPPAAEKNFGSGNLAMYDESQQIYGPPNFEALPWDVFEIREIAFRVEENYSFSGTLRNPTLRLSTYTKHLSQASPSPINNNGTDLMLVFSRASLSIVVEPPTSPTDFAYNFVLDKPFVYDRRAGSLALNIVTGLGLGEQFGVDSMLASGRFISSGGVSTGVIPTRFTVAPIPEPSAWAVAAVFIAFWLLWRRK